VGIGKDHTLYAQVDGIVRFSRDEKINRKYIRVESPNDGKRVFDLMDVAMLQKLKEAEQKDLRGF
jgi:hypothetical protein